MKKASPFFKKHIDLLIMGFIFFVLFIMPIIFTRVDGAISWKHVFKIWQDRSLLIPIFAINHWVLVPHFLSKGKFKIYFLSGAVLIAIFSFAYHQYEKQRDVKAPSMHQVERMNRKGDIVMRNIQRPEKTPSYANLIMLSMLIIGVDTGLLISKRWQNSEQEKLWLEKEINRSKLQSLQGQLSPHFFMNTLNNIYALIDYDNALAKESVMKLSKLMRYMLYENVDGKVALRKEFEFIASYIELMKIRTGNDKNISLILPGQCLDAEIPVLLFISFIENAFKYSASNDPNSFVNIVFEVIDNNLCFTCRNSIGKVKYQKGGIGMENSKKRLDILFEGAHILDVKTSEKIYHVELQIPLSCS